MLVIYSISSERTLSNIALFVERTNTFGSGIKWKNKFQLKISKYALPIKYALCRYRIYAKQGFSCIAVDDWIVIFKIDDDVFYVKQIILGSGLY